MKTFNVYNEFGVWMGAYNEAIPNALIFATKLARKENGWIREVVS